MNKIQETRTPNLFFIGVQKAGTTLWYEYLKKHPDIFLPENKEPQFFTKDELFKQGVDKYREFYSNAKDESYVGDFSPEYIFRPNAINRIKSLIEEDAKFIVSLRQPVQRAYSQFNMMVNRGFYMNSFDEDLYLDEHQPDMPEYKNALRPAYLVARGMYFNQLKRLIEAFGNENVKVIIFEEWVNNPEFYYKDILEFLGLGYYPLELGEKVGKNQTFLYQNNNNLIKFLRSINKNLQETQFSKSIFFNKFKEFVKIRIGRSPEKLDRVKVNQLTNSIFLEDIKKTENLLGRELSIWYK